jgi:hypothetical protein
MKTLKIFLFLFLFITTVKPQAPVSCDSVIYVSTYNEFQENNSAVKHFPEEIEFTYSGHIVSTTMPERRKRYYLGDIIEHHQDNVNVIKKYNAIDEGGSQIIIVLGYQKITNVKFIVIGYKNSYMYFEVKQYALTESMYYDICDENKNGYFGDNKYDHNYTDEEVKEFLTHFGEPTHVMNFIIANLFVDRKEKITETYNSQGKLTSKQ